MRTRAVLLDKDGTLIENVPMNVDPAHVRLMPGAGPALTRIGAAGFRLGVVTNQPGIAFGHFAESALRPVEHRITELLAHYDVRLGGFFYCPHHPDATIERYRRACDCRKPSPGLIRRAAAVLEVQEQDCWVVGDILDDVEAAHRAGCRAILYDSGGETEWRLSPLRLPDCVARNFDEVADMILALGSRAA